MNRLRGPIGIISAWLLVVAVGSALVWTVISRAGNDLMPAASASLRASAPAAEKSASTPAPSKPQETGKATRIKSKKPDPSDPATPSETESTVPAESDPASPTAGDPPPRDENNNHWGEGPWDGGDKTPPPTVRGTWQGTGGVVVAECVGWKISLIGAPANSGFHVEAAAWQRGIRVVFESQDVSAQKTFVFGKCHDGTPIFFDKTEGGTGGGGDNSGE